MFKGALFTAAALSVLFCVVYDIAKRVELIRTQREIAERQNQLHQYRGIDQEVRTFRLRKDELQRRIDLIDQVHRLDGNTADAVGMLNALGSEAAAIESVSVVDAKKVVVHGRAESEKLISSVASKLGINVTYEAKP